MGEDMGASIKPESSKGSSEGIRAACSSCTSASCSTQVAPHEADFSVYKYVVSKRHKCNSSKIRLISLISIFLFLLPPSSSFLLHAFHTFPKHKQTLYQLLGHPFFRFLFFPSAPLTAPILTLPTSHRYNFSFFSSFFLLSRSVAP